MDGPSLLLGFAAGIAAAGTVGLIASRRARDREVALRTETETLRRAERDATAALQDDNAALRRRIDEVADAVLARGRRGQGRPDPAQGDRPE